MSSMLSYIQWLEAQEKRVSDELHELMYLKKYYRDQILKLRTSQKSSDMVDGGVMMTADAHAIARASIDVIETGAAAIQSSTRALRHALGQIDPPEWTYQEQS